jgi:quercetin dioxygenase-like cupin family protein
LDAANPFTLLPDLLAEVPDIPKDGIVSRTVFKSGGLRAVLFAFDVGQELSEHTSAYPAVLHFLQGEATVRLADEIQELCTNSWIYMQPNLPHSILAKTPLVMLLLLMPEKEDR